MDMCRRLRNRDSDILSIPTGWDNVDVSSDPFVNRVSILLVYACSI